MKTFKIGRTSVSVFIGDITTWTGDIIVNAANSGLLGGKAWMARFIAPEGRRSWSSAWKSASSKAAARQATP